jgi:hypothetical protein
MLPACATWRLKAWVRWIPTSCTIWLSAGTRAAGQSRKAHHQRRHQPGGLPYCGKLGRWQGHGRALIRFADSRHAELIVIGTHGRTGSRICCWAALPKTSCARHIARWWCAAARTDQRFHPTAPQRHRQGGGCHPQRAMPLRIFFAVRTAGVPAQRIPCCHRPR